TILEGSVQKAGNEVLINVQLINTKTDAHIWAQSYQRTLDNVFGVEGDVAEKVAMALKAKLSPAETARINTIPTRNQAAYDAYLQGEYYRTHTELQDNLQKAAGYYRKAVAQDPKFALAWARLSEVLSSTAKDPQLSDNIQQALAAAAPAKAALDRALVLAPDSPDTQLAKGWYLDYVEMDQETARAVFESVLANHHNNAQAWLAVGTLDYHLGQLQKALENCEKASTLAPRNPSVLNMLSYTQMELRHYPEAIRTAKRWVALDPAGEHATTRLMDAHEMAGDLSGAEAAFDAAPVRLRESPDMILIHAELKMLQRDFSGARQLLSSLKPSASMPPGFITFWRGKNELWAGNTPQARHYFSQTQALYNANYAKRAGAESNHLILSFVDAGMGRASDALQQVRLGQHESVAYKSPNPFQRKVMALFFEAQIRAMLGNADAAVKALDQLLAMPAGFAVSAPLLRIDPAWDPIRKSPQFQALLKKYAKYKPAMIPAMPASTAAQAG
ncbi:MAG: tetratricopeptide repeat protein, partial [Rhodanobacteraceae bacterium]